MPTFLFIKNKAVVETIRGADKSALETAVRTHAPPAPESTSLGEGPSKDESAASRDVSCPWCLSRLQFSDILAF